MRGSLTIFRTSRWQFLMSPKPTVPITIRLLTGWKWGLPTTFLSIFLIPSSGAFHCVTNLCHLTPSRLAIECLVCGIALRLMNQFRWVENIFLHQRGNKYLKNYVILASRDSIIFLSKKLQFSPEITIFWNPSGQDPITKNWTCFLLPNICSFGRNSRRWKRKALSATGHQIKFAVISSRNRGSWWSKRLLRTSALSPSVPLTILANRQPMADGW